MPFCHQIVNLSEIKALNEQMWAHVLKECHRFLLLWVSLAFLFLPIFWWEKRVTNWSWDAFKCLQMPQFSIRFFDIFSSSQGLCALFSICFWCKRYMCALSVHMLGKKHHKYSATLKQCFCTTLFNQYFTHFAFSYVL